MMEQQLDVVVDQLAERMGALIVNYSRNHNPGHKRNPNLMTSPNAEDDDSFSDVEEEEYEEDKDRDILEADSEPIFNRYPSKEEFMSGDEETIIVNELIFDTYPPEEEFVSRDMDTILVIRSSCLSSRAYTDDWLRSNIFQSISTTLGKVCRIVIYPSSYENLVSIEAVQKLGIRTEKSKVDNGKKIILDKIYEQ